MQTTIHLSDELHERLRKYAYDHRETMSEVMRQAIDHWVTVVRHDMEECSNIHTVAARAMHNIHLRRVRGKSLRTRSAEGPPKPKARNGQ